MNSQFTLPSFEALNVQFGVADFIAETSASIDRDETRVRLNDSQMSDEFIFSANSVKYKGISNLELLSNSSISVEARASYDPSAELVSTTDLQTAAAYTANGSGSLTAQTLFNSDITKIGWGYDKVLDNPNTFGTSASDGFGSSVAISGDYAIVGAEGESSGRGVAYIFNFTTGELLHTLFNPNSSGSSTSDYFGRNVAISGNYAIVGVNGVDTTAGSNSGAAYIYNVITGQKLYTLDNPNPFGPGPLPAADDNFGSSVAITDTHAIVGSPGEGDAGGTESGKAYIYSTATGSLVYTLDNPNAYSTSAGDRFGSSVDISDSYAIVGAYQEDGADGTGSGKAYIYSTSTGSLLYTLNNPNPFGTSANDRFAFAVSISESYAIVGAYQEDDAGGTSSGKAYIYRFGIQ
jgi:hypothetical protein